MSPTSRQNTTITAIVSIQYKFRKMTYICIDVHNYNGSSAYGNRSVRTYNATAYPMGRCDCGDIQRHHRSSRAGGCGKQGRMANSALRCVGRLGTRATAPAAWGPAAHLRAVHSSSAKQGPRYQTGARITRRVRRGLRPTVDNRQGLRAAACYGHHPRHKDLTGNTMSPQR